MTTGKRIIVHLTMAAAGLALLYVAWRMWTTPSVPGWTGLLTACIGLVLLFLSAGRGFRKACREVIRYLADLRQDWPQGGGG